MPCLCSFVWNIFNYFRSMEQPCSSSCPQSSSLASRLSTSLPVLPCSASLVQSSPSTLASSLTSMEMMLPSNYPTFNPILKTPIILPSSGSSMLNPLERQTPGKIKIFLQFIMIFFKICTFNSDLVNYNRKKTITFF